MSIFMSRRAAIIGTATLAATVTSSRLSAQTATKTFVLVHGAWHGGWCWKRVSDILTQKGHNVFSPTMTGLGERSHLLSKEINLTTHIADISNTIEWESISDIVLVAHSYGGIIASGVAERLSAKISSIVFLDAFLPENGDTLLEKSSPAFVSAINLAIANGDSGIKAPPATAFGVTQDDSAWVNSKTTPQPVGTYTEKAVYSGGREKISKRTYIRAKQYKSVTFDSNLAKLQANAAWQTHELNCGHDAMIVAPKELTEILLTSA